MLLTIAGYILFSLWYNNHYFLTEFNWIPKWKINIKKETIKFCIKNHQMEKNWIWVELIDTSATIHPKIAIKSSFWLKTSIKNIALQICDVNCFHPVSWKYLKPLPIDLHSSLMINADAKLLFRGSSWTHYCGQIISSY